MTDHDAFPTARGTYILWLHLHAPAHLTIGKRGHFDFAAGWYAYVGSAQGPGGLRARLKHHLSPVQKPHWHIDYLRAAAAVHHVWYLAATTNHEHNWAATLHAHPTMSVPVPRFGASDCRCPSHLFHVLAMPTLTWAHTTIDPGLQSALTHER